MRWVLFLGGVRLGDVALGGGAPRARATGRVLVVDRERSRPDVDSREVGLRAGSEDVAVMSVVGSVELKVFIDFQLEMRRRRGLGDACEAGGDAGGVAPKALLVRSAGRSKLPGSSRY